MHLHISQDNNLFAKQNEEGEGGYIAYISTLDNEQLSLLASPSNYRDVSRRQTEVPKFLYFFLFFNFCTTFALAEYFWRVSY